MPTIPITLEDGSRVYVRCDYTFKNNNNDKNTSGVTGSIQNTNINTSNKNEEYSSKQICSLGVSMRELFRRVDVMKRRNISNAAAAARRRVKALNKNHNSNSNDDDDMLWVDKHAPASFPHLLSDERTNREVLRALRGWDPYVFNRSPPLRPLYQRQKEQEREQQQQNSGSNSSNNKNQDNKNSINNPSDKRPEESARVILLSGPPGVGKGELIIY